MEKLISEKVPWTVSPSTSFINMRYSGNNDVEVEFVAFFGSESDDVCLEQAQVSVVDGLHIDRSVSGGAIS